MPPQRALRPPFLASAVAAALLLAPRPGHACSKSSFPIVRSPSVAHFIATATADTLEAGAGEVRYQVERRPGGPGRAPERAIYGQVVEVERLGGLAAARLDGGVSRAVLVPWGYGADCRTTLWERSARWVEPGTRGVFTAVLRDPAHWVDGLPTFDVHNPYSEPYPQRVESRRYSDGAADPPLLGIDEYFALIDLLPTEEEVDAAPARAYEPLFAWARANPELARRHPAKAMLGYVHHLIGYDRIRSIDPVLAGTYRFEVSLNGSAPRVFFARTRSRPMTGWSPPPDSDEPGAPEGEGYHMLASGALSPDSLPVDCDSTRQMDREGYLAVLEEPEPGPEGGERVWRGKITMELVAHQFPADSALDRFGEDEAQRQEPRTETPARFTLSPDGAVHVQQTIELGDGRVLRITGRRISRDVIPDPE